MNKLLVSKCIEKHLLESFGLAFFQKDFFGYDVDGKIKILMYDSVFDGCQFYCSFGFNQYYQQLDDLCEVFLIADRKIDNIDYLLASSLFYLIQNKYKMGPGIAIAGLQKIDEDFVNKTGKCAIYFGEPSWLPEKKGYFKCESVTGRLYGAIFLSGKEYDYFCRNGSEALEELLEQNEADVIDVFRPCSIESI